MKRLLICLVAALPLTLGTAAANADGSGPFDLPGASVVPVVGTVVSTDAANGTFVANAYVPVPQDGGFGHDSDFFGRTPVATTQVTITTDSNTRVRVNDEEGTVGDMAAGDQFAALFTGSPGDPLETLVASPALAVLDQTPPKPQAHQLYAFVGTVTATDTTAGTVTVDVTRSLPSDLVPAGSAPVAFTIGPETLVLGGTSGGDLFGGSLSNVAVGDIVAGGVVGDAGETLAQVQSTPLKLLLDLPPAAGTGAVTQTGALNRALSVLEGSHQAVKTHKAHKSHKTHKAHRSHRRTHRAGRHSHSPKHARRA